MAWAVVWVSVAAALTHGLPLDNSPSPRAFVGFSFWPPPPEVAPVECAAANTLLPLGTCFRAAECTKIGGVASGNCPSGGVCCVVPVLCGGEVKQNNTWFVNKDFPEATSDSAICAITIRRTHAEVVQARLDLEVLDLGEPVRGHCRGDALSVTRRSAPRPLTPTLCGNNSRQHLYVDLLPGEVEVKVRLDNAHLLPRQGVPQRQWKVLITQHTQQQAAPHGCLQYYRQDTSTVRSLNYDSGLDLGDAHNYDVCFSKLARSQKSDESCNRQFKDVKMEQRNLERAMRRNQPAIKRRRTNRHGSSNSRGRNGSSTSRRRVGRSVSQPQTRQDREESDPKQYTEEDRVNFGVLDVLNLVNKTVEEVRVSGNAPGDEVDHNTIPLIDLSQGNVDHTPAEVTHPDPIQAINSLPDPVPMDSSIESSSPEHLDLLHVTPAQPTTEERPIQLVPIVESQTNEGVITQIQHVVHQLQEEQKLQQQQEEEKDEGEELGEEQLGTSTNTSSSTEATTDPTTSLNDKDPVLASPAIPATGVPTLSPEPSSSPLTTTLDTTTTTPNTITMTNDIPTTEPEIPTTTLDDSTTDPETPTTTTDPDIPTTVFDELTTTPDIPTTTYDCLTTDPGIPTTIGDIQSSVPDIQTMIYDDLTTNPDIPTTIDHIPTSDPDIQTTTSDDLTTDPDISTTTDDTPTLDPDIQTMTYDDLTTDPDILTATYDDLTTNPDTQTTIDGILTTDPEIPTTTPDIPTTTTETLNSLQDVLTTTLDTHTNAQDIPTTAADDTAPDTAATLPDIETISQGIPDTSPHDQTLETWPSDANIESLDTPTIATSPNTPTALPNSPTTISLDKTTPDVQTTSHYVSSSDAFTTGTVTRVPQTPPFDGQNTFLDAEATPLVTALSDVSGVHASPPDPELWDVKDTLSADDITNPSIPENDDDLDEMLEKLKDQFLTEYLVNGNRPAEDVGDLLVEEMGLGMPGEDDSWVTAGMMVSAGAPTVPYSNLAGDLTDTLESSSEGETPDFSDTAVEYHATNTPQAEILDEYSEQTDSTTDIDDESVTSSEAITIEELTTFETVSIPEVITEPTTEFSVTIVGDNSTTTSSTTSGDGDGLAVHLSMDAEAPSKGTHSELKETNADEHNTLTTIHHLTKTITLTALTTATVPIATTTTVTLPKTSSAINITPTASFTTIVITPATTITNLESAPSTTIATPPPTIPGSVHPTSTDNTATTTTFALKVTSVTIAALPTAITTPATVLPTTTSSSIPATTTITSGPSITSFPGTGLPMQVELTLTDPASVQIVGDLVMADHSAQSSTSEPHPILDDEIEWLILNGSETSISLPPETVVSSGIGFPGEDGQVTAAGPEVVEAAAGGEVATEALEAVTAEAEEDEGSGAFLKPTTSHDLHVGGTEIDTPADLHYQTLDTSSTVMASNTTGAEAVEASSLGHVTVTEATGSQVVTSPSVMEAGVDAGDVAQGHTTTAPVEASTGSVADAGVVHESPPTTTTSTSSLATTTTTPSTTSTTSLATTTTTTSTTSTTSRGTTTTTTTTTSPFTTSVTTEENMGVHIKIKVQGSNSQVEIDDPADNNIEAVINLITNSDVEGGEGDESHQSSDDEDDDSNVLELLEESEEDSEPEPVCGGAYLLVRQRVLCGGQLRLSLPDQNTPDDRFEDVERFSVRTLNGATRSLRFSMSYHTKCPRAPSPPTTTPAPTRKTVTLLQYLLGWYR